MALLMRSSNFKPQVPQQPERKATTFSEYQQEVFYLQDELAEVRCAHLQEMYCAALVRFKECKDSSSISKLLITHTKSLKKPRRMPSPKFDSTNVKDCSSFQLHLKKPRRVPSPKLHSTDVRIVQARFKLSIAHRASRNASVCCHSCSTQPM